MNTAKDKARPGVPEVKDRRLAENFPVEGKPWLLPAIHSVALYDTMKL
jgi:hypothetical protein